MFTRMRTRIKTAAPFPRVGIVRIAAALGNRPDMNVAVINVPAFMAVVCGSAAGELGCHTRSKRTLHLQANRPKELGLGRS